MVPTFIGTLDINIYNKVNSKPQINTLLIAGTKNRIPNNPQYNKKILINSHN